MDTAEGLQSVSDVLPVLCQVLRAVQLRDAVWLGGCVLLGHLDHVSQDRRCIREHLSIRVHCLAILAEDAKGRRHTILKELVNVIHRYGLDHCTECQMAHIA